MHQKMANVALLVRDYDEALAFYVGKLGFDRVEDTDLGGGKRWVRAAPRNAETCLLLAQASSPDEVELIGNQSGGRVFLFLHTDDFWRDYRAMVARGVVFCEEPRDEPYGTVAVFEDLYGTQWDLLQPKG